VTETDLIRFVKAQADVYNHEVEIVEAEEGAAYGAAILAGVGAKAWASVDEACAATVRVAQRIAPDPRASELMRRNYALYRRIYPALREAFETTSEELRTSLE